VPTGTGEQYRGLDAVDRRTAWVSGEDGGVLRTTDGGHTWDDVAPAGTEGMALRDVEAHDADRASVLAIGTGTDSRIYTTTDGGASWTLAFVNDREEAFYDCMDFFAGGRRGLALSDPVDGEFRILETRDGGLSWSVVDADMPAAADGEFAFAASGTCLVTVGGRHAWFTTSDGDSRVFRSGDGGRTWQVSAAPIPATDAGGVFSLAFRNPRQGVAVGGDFLLPADGSDTTGVTDDGGTTWVPGGDVAGYRSGVDWVSGAGGRTLVAVGPTGSDVSAHRGRTCRTFDDTAYDSVVCVGGGTCWASGPDGAVATLRR